mmetsp:Transcript_62017/g.100336  ORF Transcript_62017/g.100336 Transcript_62017/m.100336 type:complete len:203 (-) Transcript_62017:5-613(-)
MPPEPECEDAKRNFTLASQAKQSEDFQSAISLYTKGLDTARTVELRSALLCNRSAARSNLKLYDEAVLDANECLTARPSWSSSYDCLAMALEGLGRTNEAQLCQRLALELAALKKDPTNESLKQQVRAIRQDLAAARAAPQPHVTHDIQEPPPPPPPQLPPPPTQLHRDPQPSPATHTHLEEEPVRTQQSGGGGGERGKKRA